MKTEQVVIDVAGLSKKFNIYRTPSDLVKEFLIGKKCHDERWALKNTDFKIKRGEVVGIIGRNGAGKSTLLKILAGTLNKTSGTALVTGKVSAILELGIGLNPLRSGRDNIFLGGLCLGLNKEEIKRKMADIIEFSELEEFIDQPIKTYSTGMYARLAFSIAISADPEILIVDEALAVGDVKFQKKCFAFFETMKAKGKTILLVTHSPETIDAICDRAIYLRNGRVEADGVPKYVTGRYLQDMLGEEKYKVIKEKCFEKHEDSGNSESIKTTVFRYGNGGVNIQDYGIADLHGGRQGVLQNEKSYRFFVRAMCELDYIDGLNIGITVRNVKGVELFTVNPIYQKKRIPRIHKNETIDIEVSFVNHFAPGDYFVTFGAWGLYSDTHYDRLVDAYHFHVSGSGSMGPQSVVDIKPEYHFNILSSQP